MKKYSKYKIQIQNIFKIVIILIKLYCSIFKKNFKYFFTFSRKYLKIHFDEILFFKLYLE